MNASELTEDDVERMAAEGDLEGLVKALKRGGNRRAQAIAAIHLGKTGDPRAVEPPNTSSGGREPLRPRAGGARAGMAERPQSGGTP